VFLIMFKTGQALPLRERRTWCPRMSRGGHAEYPRHINRSWTWHWPVHGLDSAGDRTRTGTFRVREQSVSAFSPRQQSCPQNNPCPRTGNGLNRPQQATVRNNGLSAVQSAAVNNPCPELVTHAICPRPWIRQRIIRVVASRCPSSPPIHFPIHVQIIPAHVLI
jgi:hypothetical protein